MLFFIFASGFICGVLFNNKSVWTAPTPSASGYGPIQFIPITSLPKPISINSDTRAPPNRIFFDALGTFIQSASFLPIEINVPDTIETIYNGAINGAAERFPLINRWITGTEPRPYPPNLLVLLPMMGGQPTGTQPLQPAPQNDHIMEKFLGLHLPFTDLKYKPKKKIPLEDSKLTTQMIHESEDTKKIINEKDNKNCTIKSKVNLIEAEDVEATKVLMEYLKRVKEHNKLFKNGINGNRLIVPEPIMFTYLDTNIRDNNDFQFTRGTEGGYGLYPLYPLHSLN